MVTLRLKDNIEKQVKKGTTVLEAAKETSEGLVRNACAALIDGRLTDLREPLNEDCSLNILTFDSEGGSWAFRHTSAHILAQAVKRRYPDAKLAIGPAIDDGFYYDIEFVKPISNEDLITIEEEMRKIIKENLPIQRFELCRSEALAWAEQAEEPYKLELIHDLPEGEPISFYRQGEFTDLCAGPHLMSTKPVKAIKLTSLAGAYWRGNEKNKMLTRIYGTSFTKAVELEAYIERIEEAKRRDHRKLGRELELFTLLEEGPGLPFFMPKGMILKNALLDYWRELHNRDGYQEVSTPMILNKELWIRSGHWDHYRENMYTTEIDEKDFCLKPMNCPGGMLIYKQSIHSYKDLPVRMGELGYVHRHEKSGALHGLMRVRAFTQDDAHIYMSEEQIKDEIKSVVSLIDEIYKKFNFKYYIELSTRPENSMGTEEAWEQATGALASALGELGMDYRINEGDGAFYGPKIDFHLEDTIGRTWQCGTIQLDFQLPEKFELEYIGSDGERHRPVMIHRTVFGSIERFIGILIEHFAGQFPVWLAPVQVKVLPISEKLHDYANVVAQKLKQFHIRTETDYRVEKIGYKIREARNQRVPYILVVGEKEAQNGTISLRSRLYGDEGSVKLEEYITRIRREIETREL